MCEQYVVINIHNGFFQYTRLPFGLSSAPGIIHHVMENVLQHISKVVVYLDYIILLSAIKSDHSKLLDHVLDCIEKAGLSARKQKCKFLAMSVRHKIDSECLKPLPHKVEVIQNA